MKSFRNLFLTATFTLAALSLVLVSAQTEQKPKPQTGEPKPEIRVREGFSPDEVYKSNCTRCHSELPKVSERRTKTIVRHMQVRANMTQAEAKAVLEYMTQ